jgi:hypothetical protein
VPTSPWTFGRRTSGRAHMKARVARCHCGAVELRCKGRPRKISMCHCLDCQRRTGSPFSVAVFYPREKVDIGGGRTKNFERNSASGSAVKFSFCVRCGSNVYWETRRLPALIGVALGAFANPKFPRPTQSVWSTDKHHWLVLPKGIAEHEFNSSTPRVRKINGS